MASETTVATRALRRLGQPPVTVLDGSTPQGAILLDLFVGTRDALLVAAKPRFAWARASLAEDAAYAALTTRVGWAHRYPVPADYLAPLGLGPEEEAWSDPWTEEGGAILTDLGAPLPLRYVARVTDVARWSGDFVDLMALTLAAEAAYPITESTTRAEALRQEADAKLTLLRHDQSLRGTPPRRSDERRLTDVRV